MSDYGHRLAFGAFVTPKADHPEAVVGLARIAERVGLDLVAVQDHPYQSRFLDTWTLLTWIAARTERIAVVPDVANLPLRQPAVLARAAASLDLLSGGRVELGLGAGGFWDAIEAMGGRRLTAGQSVDALAEAVAIIRGIWGDDNDDDDGGRSRLVVDGRWHRVDGAKRGPAPAHRIGIWIGGYRPRMLGLTGRLADGWLPSLGYLRPLQLAESSRLVDDAAIGAGRSPGDVRRVLNVFGRFADRDEGLLVGPPASWAQQLADLALEHGFSVFIGPGDEVRDIEVFAAEVAPAVRELVAQARA